MRLINVLLMLEESIAYFLLGISGVDSSSHWRIHDFCLVQWLWDGESTKFYKTKKTCRSNPFPHWPQIPIKMDFGCAVLHHIRGKFPHQTLNLHVCFGSCFHHCNVFLLGMNHGKIPHWRATNYAFCLEWNRYLQGPAAPSEGIILNEIKDSLTLPIHWPVVRHFLFTETMRGQSLVVFIGAKK